jgi:hypothetical protein
MGNKWGCSKQLYEDIVKIYDKTTDTVDPELLEEITQLSLKYPSPPPSDSRWEVSVDKVLSIIYAAFIAEENYPNTMLGKRVKRLGLYQVLIEGMDPYEASQYSVGMDWEDIAEACRVRGF